MRTNPPRAGGGALTHALRRLCRRFGSAPIPAPAWVGSPDRPRSTPIAFALGLPDLGDDPDHDCPAAADDHDLWWSGEPEGEEPGAAAERSVADRAMTQLSLSYRERPGVDAIEALERLSLSGHRTRGRDPRACGPINALDRLG